MARVRKHYNKYKTLQANDFIPMHERQTSAIINCFTIFITCMQNQVFVRDLLANGVMIFRLVIAYELINPDVDCTEIKNAIERVFKQIDHLNPDTAKEYYTQKVFFTNEEQELLVYLLESVKAHILTISSRLKFSIFLKQVFVDSNVYIALMTSSIQKWMNTGDVDEALELLRNNINRSYKNIN